ncbi:MAG: cyclic nucleotide-binding domain-containing protein [Burkholderiaceae bacterium]
MSRNGFSDCHTCAVRQSALFAHMSEADFAAIHYPIDEIRLRPGALLYDNGERADYLFTVRAGALKVEHEGASGQRRVTAMMVRGDLIGLSAYVLGNYDGRVIALTDAMVCRLPIACCANSNDARRASCRGCRKSGTARWCSPMPG